MAPSCLPRSQRHAAVVLPPRVVQFHAHPLALREAGEAHKAHRAARRLGPSRGPRNGRKKPVENVENHGSWL